MKPYKTYDITLVNQLRISCSLKKNLTYWALVNIQWKRIAKKYYFILATNSINTVSKSSKGLLISKVHNRCSNFNKIGLQCKHVASLGSKCCLHHKKIFSFIDLFAGAGGFSLGLKHAGLKHIYGVDTWPIASKTYVANIGIGICSGVEILKPPALNVEVDLLIASPPCQAFSLANTFYGSISSQYQQIGNAVPCLFAYQLGVHLLNFF